MTIALLERADCRPKLANATMYELWQLLVDHEFVVGQPVFEGLPGARRWAWKSGYLKFGERWPGHCEKVVTNHGGAVTARSQPGKGVIFI